jgi:multidrug efflux pump subunit AcrB
MLAVLIVLMGGYAILRTATDIFPNIKIPIAAVIWRYNGILPEEIANRIVLFSERIAQTTVNDVEHTESQSVNGTSVVKYFFQPDVDPDLSFAQITAISQTQLFFSPPGTSPPFILSYSASSVPILQLALSSDSLSEAQIYDMGNTILRTQLATVAGASIPFPYGGKQRQVQVDLDPQALRANGLSPNDVVNAIGQQNLILPAGTEKIGSLEYYIKLNASPTQIEDLNNMPVRAQNGTVTYVHDVAHVRDGYSPQTNMVRVNGRRSVLMSVLKTGKASTIDIINSINQKLPQIRASLPGSLKVEPTSDQSVFVRSAISGVIREALIAGALTGLLILLFLGSWRSTLIITISIPLSILASIACLSALGETINIMTLGGLALAVGILVDDATVTIENINYHLESGKDVEPAILDGAQQIALPALVSTLCICIVFIPMFLLAGIAKFLFIPLAEAVVFAMLASYLLSRTLVPTLAKFWLKVKVHEADKRRGNPLSWWQASFERGFERLRERYRTLLASAVRSGPRFAAVFIACMAATAVLAFPLGPLPGLGQDFFPAVDGGQIKLHMRARTGTRIEETAALCDAVEATIRGVIPSAEVVNIVDNIGLPYSGINLAYSTSAPVGPGDADIYVNLAPHHKPTADYVRALRSKLAATYPSAIFAFLPADMIGQILNFGLPSPIDVQVSGRNLNDNFAYATKLKARVAQIAGAADVRIQQIMDQPTLLVAARRSFALGTRLTESNIANNLLSTLSGSGQVAPTYWLDPNTGVTHLVNIQTPQDQLTTVNSLQIVPVDQGNGNPTNVQPELVGGLSAIDNTGTPGVVSHDNIMPVIDIYANVEGRDLGAVSRAVQAAINETSSELPRGVTATLQGQTTTMNIAYVSLLIGLGLSIVLIYLVIVVNFQSWLDPFIVISALPAALAGVTWSLFLTGTTLSVPALTGAIMCMGTATANTILVVDYARGRLAEHGEPFTAAVEAGFARIRPVLMTALAMILGMLPMSLSNTQNAPLGRAVIGGLLVATVTTLVFVPCVFAILHRAKPRQGEPA